jgi:hypothetical protein
MSNPELGALHRDLVMGGQITEAEFWEGREVLLVFESSLRSSLTRGGYSIYFLRRPRLNARSGAGQVS